MAEKPSESVKEIDGVRKAAILLLSLDQEAAAAILSSMPPKAVEEVTREVASTHDQDPGPDSSPAGGGDGGVRGEPVRHEQPPVRQAAALPEEALVVNELFTVDVHA